MSKIKIGDVVTLNSGGPPMTVVNIDGEDAAVNWFREGEHEGFRFPPQCLTLVSRQNFSGEAVAREMAETLGNVTVPADLVEELRVPAPKPPAAVSSQPVPPAATVITSDMMPPEKATGRLPEAGG